ncbi:MAG: sigma-54-dependent Fis family transcriptional regulator [Ignavibacteriales bacterium]|nr:sigma-54-dependent Fis family transcriptional regulator [Ignavibacteriales bacterium]
MGKRILVIDDEEFIRMNLKNIFDSEGYAVDLKENGTKGLDALTQNEYDLAFLDINLPDINGLEILKQIKTEQPELLVIIITGFSSVESAVDALKLGAYDYIKKPFKADAIKLITKLALETQQLKQKVKKLEVRQKSPLGIDSIVGESEQVLHLKTLITEYAKHDATTVLITGESGTGKELIASSIHSLSPRAAKPYIEINCASIPEQLLESELFGFERGAFTDAKERKIGLFEAANGGTIFLDEIGELSLGLQAKLLRVIENNKIRRLGSNKDLDNDIRIISATNKDLKKAIDEKEFRKDLYYRLNVLRINVPSLRERGNDILLLANYFLNIFRQKFGKDIIGFDKEAESTLLNYGWPGNVRELKNVMERTCILQKEKIILKKNLAVDSLMNMKKDSFLNEEDLNFELKSYDEILSDIEVKLINKALALSNMNVSETARLLKIPRETLRYKIAKFNLSPQSD